MAILQELQYVVLLIGGDRYAKETSQRRGKYPQAQGRTLGGTIQSGPGPGETGKQIFKNVLGRTQAEVKDKLRKAQEAANGIDFTKTESYTVEEWMRIWFETYSKPQIRETTAACTVGNCWPCCGRIWTSRNGRSL